MAEIENHDFTTTKHEMKTQGCTLKEIIKKVFVHSQFPWHYQTIVVKLRTIEDDRKVVRSFKGHPFQDRPHPLVWLHPWK